MRGPEAYLEKFTEGLCEGSIHESSKVGRDDRIFKRGHILSPTTERTHSYLLTDTAHGKNVMM